MRWKALSSICMSARSLRSSALSGSSSSSRCGAKTSARASATRCCWPPESWRGKPVGQRAELDEAQRVADLLVDLGLGRAAHLERKGDVARHGEVRKQRIALEHHAEVALVRRQVLDRLAVQQDAAAGRRHEARDRHQHRGLARARRSEQRQELATRDAQRHVVQRRNGSIMLRDPVERQFLQPGHQLFRFTMPLPPGIIMRWSCQSRNQPRSAARTRAGSITPIMWESSRTWRTTACGTGPTSTARTERASRAETQASRTATRWRSKAGSRL